MRSRFLAVVSPLWRSCACSGVPVGFVETKTICAPGECGCPRFRFLDAGSKSIMTPSRFVHGFNLLKGLNMRYFACTLAISFALCASSAHSQTFRTLLAFTGTSGAVIGAEPQGSLISDGTTLYGMTLYGGVNSYGNVFSVATDGSSYHIFFLYRHRWRSKRASIRQLDIERHSALRHDFRVRYRPVWQHL